MTKFSFKFLTILLLILTGFGVGLTSRQGRNVFAEDAPNVEEFFSVTQMVKEGDEFVDIENPPAFNDGSAIFLRSGSAVSVVLGENGDINYTEKISNLTYKILINGGQLSFENTPVSALETYGLELSLDNTSEFGLLINPDGAQNFVYGKYEIELNFIYTVGDEPIRMSKNSTIYVLDYDSYFNNISFVNNKNLDANTGINVYSNYSTNELLFLSYNYKYFNVNINRVYQGLNTTTRLFTNNGTLEVSSTNEVGEQTDAHVVKVVNTSKNSTAKLVFNDLGVYYLTYTPINNGNGSEIISKFYSETVNTANNVYVFGYQTYITTQGGLSEFKITNNSEPWAIDGSEYSADITSVIDEENISEAFGIPVSEIAKTNQAPISFATNATINVAESYYYYFENDGAFSVANKEALDGVVLQDGQTRRALDGVAGYMQTQYEASPLSKAGIYFVKLAYSYANCPNETDEQYFLFKITNEAPSVDVYNATNGEDKNYLSNNQFTNEPVRVQKSTSGIFDAKSTLTVYRDASFTGNNYDAGTIITDGLFNDFELSGKYKVQLTYGNSNKKSFTSYFVIDNTEISEIEFKNAYRVLGTNYIVGDQLQEIKNSNDGLAFYYTSNAVALSWLAKASGARVIADYKFIPTAYSSTTASSLTSNSIKGLYESSSHKYAIISNHVLTSYIGDLPTATYENTYGQQELVSSRVLSAGGLYLFHIYDNTGAEGKYFAIFIDTTPNNIITVTNGIYQNAPESEVTTQNKQALFGKYKYIMLESFSDQWLQKFLTNDTGVYFADYRSDKYLKILINPTVHYSINSKEQAPLVLNENNNFGTGELQAGNDKQYVFYTIAETTQENQNYDGSYDFYKKNYTAMYSVTFTTDNSQTLVYYTEDGVNMFLQQADVTNLAENEKVVYYQPTAQKTLSKAEEQLSISYCITPREDIEVESIQIKYYAFSKGANATYIFDLQNPSAIIDVYIKDSINRGTAKGASTTDFTYLVNLETYDGSKLRTRDGRYEIIRTYTTSSVLPQNDPLIRKLVFIVDRNAIVTEPSVAQDGSSTTYVGGAIGLQILTKFGTGYYDEEPTTLHFNDIYFASKLNKEELTPVLTTNFMPVTVYIPTYKYGYIKNVEGYPTFVPEESIVALNSDDQNLNANGMVYYSNYKLTATISHYKTISQTSLQKVYYYNATISGFLTTAGAGNTIASFNEEGYYRVIINSEAGDEFSFDFEIKYESPKFKLLDSQDVELVSDGNGIYYTNKQKIQIAWEDSPSKFLASINKKAISYRVNGNYSGILGESTPIHSDGNRHYAELDLASINAYKDGTKLEITLQFNGNKEDYNDSKYFSTTITLMVDIQAPSYNIATLIAQTGLSYSDLRTSTKNEFGAVCDISQNTGLFKYFSYTVDVENFNNLIKNPTNTDGDYYKIYYNVFEKGGENTKYVIGNADETNVTPADLAGKYKGILFTSGDDFGLILNSYKNKYIEFIEEDYAGNRTVYTIYLSDNKQLADEVALEYVSITNNDAGLEGDNPTIKYSELSESIELYSKYSFKITDFNPFRNDVIGNLSWQLIEVKGVLYVKTPYSEGRYYSYSDFKDGADNVSYDISEITTLGASANSQEIIVYNVPIVNNIKINVYVLNKALEFYTLATKEQTNMVEGLLVKLPIANSGQNNLIYATGVTIRPSSSLLSLTVDEKYLIGEEENLPISSVYELSYVDYKTQRFLQIKMLGAININDYYVYTITDNFGEVYSLVHIYGQTEINDPITSDGGVVTSYDETGALVYYSSENILYKYDTTIYNTAKITILIEARNMTYFIEKTQLGFDVKNDVGTVVEDYTSYFTVEKRNNIFTIIMKQMMCDFKTSRGGSIAFLVELVPNEVFEIENDVKKFKIFNEIPSTLALISKSSATNVTSILNGKTAYSGQIIINFSYILLEFDYEVLIQKPNGEILVLTDGLEIIEDGTYSITINYLGDIKGCSKTYEFTIANAEGFIYSVVKQMDDGSHRTISSTGASYSYMQDDIQITIATHYIVNANYEIVLNSNLFPNPTTSITKTSLDEYTTIYSVSNLHEVDNHLISGFYTLKFAVTQIPNTSSIIKKFEQYGNNIKEDSNDLLALRNPAITPYITTKEEYNGGVKVAWSQYHLLKENLVNVQVYYGSVDGDVYSPKIETINSLNGITLKTSGTYYLKFYDMAGNVQMFGLYGDYEYFTIKYLSSVIFNVDGQTPINYAIYDKDVTISVPENTMAYYDINAKPNIFVELDGVSYKEYTKNEDGTFTFAKPGFYKVWFTAKIDEKNIYEAPTYFTILSSKESRLTYSYEGYGNYYIKDILKDGVSVYNSLANVNNGELVEIDGAHYLKNISLHANDIKTGRGYWTFVVSTNNEFEQEFEFTVWINKSVVPIMLSINNGGSSSGEIYVRFNTKNVLSQAGDCILKITGFEDFYITQELLDTEQIEEIYNVPITSAGEYYVEVTTLSGQLLYSSFVIKTEPLNAVSIIIIVVAVIAVIAGVVLFILLRRRMKIR